MLRKLLILTILSLCGLPAIGQLAGGAIALEGLTAVETDGVVAVSFTLDIAPDAVGKKETYILAPVLTDGNYRVSLPAVVIEGRRTKVSRERRAWIASGDGYTDEIRTAAGRVVNYHATTPAQGWMHGGRLYVEGVSGSCCGQLADRNLVLADPLVLYREPQPRKVVTEIRRFRPKSVADSLSMIFPFIIPEAMFDPDDPYKIYDEEHDNSMIVYFHQGRNDINPAYRDNAQTLLNLSAAVEMILGESSSRVERVVVAGFASPEGSYTFNERLAYNRAVAVKGHLIATTGLREDQVWLHNGGIDWRGLRMLVARSAMDGKERIMEIIDDVPVMDPSGRLLRLTELMNLDGGGPYRYMLREFFPLLRNGAFIKVYYSNSDTRPAR